jgi:hypothetical protein
VGNATSAPELGNRLQPGKFFGSKDGERDTVDKLLASELGNLVAPGMSLGLKDRETGSLVGVSMGAKYGEDEIGAGMVWTLVVSLALGVSLGLEDGEAETLGKSLG